MKNLKKTNLKEFKESWTFCGLCGGCYYRGPIVPHNWRDLPPPEWLSPLHKCPSFEYYEFRAYTAMGRGNLATLVFDNRKFPLSDDLIKIAYTCASCGICMEICQVFQPLMAIWALREEMVQRGIELPDPLDKIHTNIKQYGNIFGAKRLPEIAVGFPTTGKNIYFAGCAARFQKSEVIKNTLRILKSSGIDIAYLGGEEKCCGFIAGHDGKTELLEQQAVLNVEILKNAGAKQVIMSCADCFKTFKLDYPLIVGKLPFEVIHISQLLAQLIENKKIKFTVEIEREVTYHDPCFLGRHCKVYEEPRKVLTSIPGIRLIEMERNKRWSYCCGSGAKIISNCYPDFGAFITRDRLLEGKRSANTIVTACTSCLSTMSRAIDKMQIDVAVLDLSTLVAKAMGIKSD